jgi:hypothetical protein
MGPPDDPVDRLIVQLRGYIEAGAASKGQRGRRWDGETVLVFDTETTTDPSQRLQFGAYQLRRKGALIERGIFYGDVDKTDMAALRGAFTELRATEDGETLKFLSRKEFVDELFYGWGYDTGALIVGFNLPFDISRLATSHTRAKNNMRGGFSFELTDVNRFPNVRVKHLTQRASFIDFPKLTVGAATNAGFFLDLKTLAAALTSQSYSLKSLAEALKTTPKSEVETHDGPLTAQRIAYGLNDVQVTWECCEALLKKYAAFGLKTGVEQLWSEASLGKAFLMAMNVQPWRAVQPGFPASRIGEIMSTYFGGRAEVHIRREITPVIHCDFLSMYPTVCTLMKLWDFVIADGIEESDATSEVRDLVEGVSKDDLKDKALWLNLTCIVQVLPANDIFPVRARYERERAATIGLNRLSSDRPLWFTLADVLASKLLTGRAPRIVQAIRFTPKGAQKVLTSITFAGAVIRPAKDDFYKLLIDQRRLVQKAEAEANAPDVKAQRKAEQQSLKILANSTSYGIFVELNVNHIDDAVTVNCHGYDGVSRRVRAKKVEEPGRYFHPLLATLITGAARLMLALAERGAIDQGLDWAFCDTDSLAIAKPEGMGTTDFLSRVECVRGWFTDLNPYEAPGAILQLEKVNFPPAHKGDMARLRPTNCLAISAKRYVLFDRDEAGAPLIRKGSRHGLGHLLPPYPDPDRARRMDEMSIERWQEDLWKAVIAAHDAGLPDQVDYQGLKNFTEPVASRYAATNPQLLGWFKAYNEVVETKDQVQPFNFLLTFQAKTPTEMEVCDPMGLLEPVWIANRVPRPASRYSSDLVKDRPAVFDRDTGHPIKWCWLQSYARTLSQHHLHSEMKFRGGEGDARGVLRRRHVQLWSAQIIGKEADNLAEREVLGEEDDAIEWELANEEQRRIAADIEEILKSYRLRDKELWSQAKVSHHTLAALRRGRSIEPQALFALADTAEAMRQEGITKWAVDEHWIQVGRRLMEKAGGRNALAKKLGFAPSTLTRVLNRSKPMTAEMIKRLERWNVLQK